MPLRESDYLLGPSRVTDANVTHLLGQIDRPDAKDREFIARLRHWCGVAGVDDANALSQTIWETGNFESVRWNRDLNPVGLGITGDATIQPFAITNVDEAARVTVQAIYAMVKKQWHPGVPMPDGAVSWMNGVWLPKVRDPRYPPNVERVKDQNIIYVKTGGNPRYPSATWAADPAYMGHVARFNRMVPGVPDQAVTPPKEPPVSALTFGNVPHPPFVDLIVTNRYWSDLGPRRPVGVGQHSMVGSLLGSYLYIRDHGGQALWDYSVGGSTDGENDGVIWRHNDPRGRRSGWANGGSDGLEGDGPLFVRTLGIDAINRDLVSIERSDGAKPNTQPMSPKQFESIAQLTAYWFDQARVPWDRFPFNPNVGCVTHMLHKEFATKDCPFPPVYTEINRLQDRVRAILKAAQTAAVEEPETPPPAPVEQDHDRYPNGWTAGELKQQWGILPRHNPGGSVTSLHFAVTKNPIAAIANTWVHRGAADGITDVRKLPKPQVWQVLQIDEDTKSDLITFEGGRDAWQLFRPNKWVPWTWIDEAALKAKGA